MSAGPPKSRPQKLKTAKQLAAAFAVSMLSPKATDYSAKFEKMINVRPVVMTISVRLPLDPRPQMKQRGRMLLSDDTLADGGRLLSGSRDATDPCIAPGRRILQPGEAAGAVRRGILRAARDCERWGGDWPSDRGCENLIQVRAAEELHEVLSSFHLGWVTLEEPVSNVSWAGTTKRGRRYVGMSDQQRADIAIWSRSENVYGLVEMKRAEDVRGWLGDLEKLSRLLSTYGRRHGNHLRYGVLGAYISGPNASVVRRRAARLRAHAVDVAVRFSLRHRTTFDPVALHHFGGGGEDGWTCGAATVELRS